MSSAKQKVLVIIIAAVSLFFILLASGTLNDISREWNIRKGVRLINSGEYVEAAEWFDEMQEKMLEKNEFDSEVFTLEFYAEYLRNKGNDLKKEKHYLDCIRSDYKGHLADEILAEKAAVDKKCQELINAQKAEVDEDPNKYRDTIPFVGMNALYIDKTYLGTHYGEAEKGIIYKDGISYYTYEYTFVTVYGDLLLMKVTCTDYLTENVVTNVKKYNEAYLWQGDVPNVVASEYKDVKKPDTSSKPGYSGNYGGYEYNDYEDFYYDHEEDFDSLDDAEDYYNEYYDDFD